MKNIDALRLLALGDFISFILILFLLGVNFTKSVDFRENVVVLLILILTFLRESVWDNPRFDGFLSFRGVDTRDTFSKQIKEALEKAGFIVFYDDDHIGEEDFINKKIKAGIKKLKNTYSIDI